MHSCVYKFRKIFHGPQNILIDTLPERSAPMLLEALQDILGSKPLDAIIANHSEEDYSGALTAVLQAYPGVPVYGTANCQHRLLPAGLCSGALSPKAGLKKDCRPALYIDCSRSRPGLTKIRPGCSEILSGQTQSVK
jgi:glyoxylase-like metal-dependent hydrolase (beta-lactamase superfamily II)